MKKFLKTLSWGGGNSLKPSSSACFEQYSNVKLGVRKGAFTLAEVLITLGIIGVVAAMTIPTLMTNYQKKSTATQMLIPIQERQKISGWAGPAGRQVPPGCAVSMEMPVKPMDCSLITGTGWYRSCSTV